MASTQQNMNLQRLLKAEENANRQIREAKNKRRIIFEEIGNQVANEIKEYQNKKNMELEVEKKKYKNNFTEIEEQNKRIIQENKAEYTTHKDKGISN